MGKKQFNGLGLTMKKTAAVMVYLVSELAETVQEALAVFGGSGTNHSSGLVPDPGATEGNTKYLREDGTWAVPEGGNNKEDKMTVVTQNSGTTLTAAVGNYYRLTYSVGTLAVTLPAPTGSNAQSVLFFLTAGASPNVTFTSSGNDVYYSDGFSIDASSTYEINALWNGAAWIITAVKINIV